MKLADSLTAKLVISTKPPVIYTKVLSDAIKLAVSEYATKQVFVTVTEDQ